MQYNILPLALGTDYHILVRTDRYIPPLRPKSFKSFLSVSRWGSKNFTAISKVIVNIPHQRHGSKFYSVITVEIGVFAADAPKVLWASKSLSAPQYTVQDYYNPQIPIALQGQSTYAPSSLVTSSIPLSKFGSKTVQHEHLHGHAIPLRPWGYTVYEEIFLVTGIKSWVDLPEIEVSTHVLTDYVEFELPTIQVQSTSRPPVGIDAVFQRIEVDSFTGLRGSAELKGLQLTGQFVPVNTITGDVQFSVDILAQGAGSGSVTFERLEVYSNTFLAIGTFTTDLELPNIRVSSTVHDLAMGEVQANINLPSLVVSGTIVQEQEISAEVSFKKLQVSSSYETVLAEDTFVVYADLSEVEISGFVTSEGAASVEFEVSKLQIDSILQADQSIVGDISVGPLTLSSTVLGDTDPEVLQYEREFSVSATGDSLDLDGLTYSRNTINVVRVNIPQVTTNASLVPTQGININLPQLAVAGNM